MNIFHEGWEPLENIEIPCNNTREELEQRSFLNSIDLVLDTLNEREQIVIRERFWNDKTYTEIAEHFNICGGRVSQIEAKALRKLRHRNRISFLIEDNKETISMLKEFDHEFKTSTQRDPEVLEAHKRLLQKVFEKNRKSKEWRAARKEQLALLEKQKEEKRKVFEENHAFWKKDHQERLRQQKLMQEKGEEINHMLYGNGVPSAVFLSVTKDSEGHITYSITTIPGKEHLIQDLDPQTRGKWIQLLIQRAKWMEKNYR